MWKDTIVGCWYICHNCDCPTPRWEKRYEFYGYPIRCCEYIKKGMSMFCWKRSMKLWLASDQDVPLLGLTDLFLIRLFIDSVIIWWVKIWQNWQIDNALISTIRMCVICVTWCEKWTKGIKWRRHILFWTSAYSEVLRGKWGMRWGIQPKIETKLKLTVYIHYQAS